jgi:hypothetical protein
MQKQDIDALQNSEFLTEMKKWHYAGMPCFCQSQWHDSIFVEVKQPRREPVARRKIPHVRHLW